MEEMGFFTGVLPFVISYTLFFFLLREIKLFGKDNNKNDQFAAILSIAFAFFTAQFLVENPIFQQFFVDYLGRLTILIIGLLGLLILIGFVGIDLRKNGLVGAILAVLAITAFAVSGGIRSFFPLETQNESLAILFSLIDFMFETGLIFILVIIALLYFTMGGFGDGNESEGESGLGKVFKAMSEAADSEEDDSD